MFRAPLWCALGSVLWAALSFSRLAAAAPPDDVAELRQQIEVLKRDYDARLLALSERVTAAEAAARLSQAPSATVPAPAPARRGLVDTAFNPAISMILQGRYARFSDAAGSRGIPGFLLGGEAGVGAEGLSLGESELDISANIDDRFYGFFDAALNDDGSGTEVEIEEAYLQTLSLPAGLRVKAGQFFSAVGYHNARHSHTWDFVDTPLAYEALLGSQYFDPGVQVVWVAPTETFLELGAEAFAGLRFPAAGGAHRGVGATSVFAKLGGDVGESHSWQAGVAYLLTDPHERESLGELPLHFTGDSNVLLAHLVWKWAPRGNFRQRNFTFQAEVLHRHEDGGLRLDDPSGPRFAAYRGDQLGYYVQGVYQPLPRWRLGLRYGELFSDNHLGSLGVSTPLDRDGFTPRRFSAMVDFSNSEFSRLRLQFSRDRAGGSNENEVFLQYIMSLGSHGAHQF